ncbi:hypothetical protein J1605_000980 [Eschrichtius robustus]|uniref:Uncharacterized protein n=1 Tax=Eschrichtius robustus TaxID=9764 RepID=A0AB34GPN1_ESCRO|nr:hypothetical protein J1605_000980 [Eschrichtius robustus]
MDGAHRAALQLQQLPPASSADPKQADPPSVQEKV